MLLGPGINATMQRTNQLKMKHPQLSYSDSGSPHVKISWLRQPRPIAKEIASTFRSYVARYLHFVAKDKKEPSLPSCLFLG